MNKKNIFKFTTRFLLIYLLIYILFETLVSNIESLSTIIQSSDYFMEMNSSLIISYLSQSMKALIIALIIYPFYEIIFHSKFRYFLLIGLMWGLSTLCSIETIPGSIEGFIYTVVPFKVHLMILIKEFIFVSLFSIVFTKVELKFFNQKIFTTNKIKYSDKSFWGYLKRFVITYVVAYILMGIIFMLLQDYQTAFNTMESFKHFRPLDSKIVQFAALFQIFRGSMIATILYPFYNKIFNNKTGWVKLFILLYGFTFVTSSGQIPHLITKLITVDNPLYELIVGLPEVTFQMLFFSIAFFVWERKSAKTNNFLN